MKRKYTYGGSYQKLQKVLRIFRISLIILLIYSAKVFGADTYAQNTKFTFRLNNVTINEVIKTIEAQSEFIFLFQERHVDLERRIDLIIENMEIEAILNQVFEETDNTFEVIDRQIVIGQSLKYQSSKSVTNRKESDLLTSVQSQQKEISGKVTDTNGLPLPGVSVVVKGTTIGTVTNGDGSYSLRIPASAEILRFSFVGMTT